MEENRATTVRQASFRLLRRLGQVIQELHQLGAPGEESSPQIQRIESELVCNAIDIAELFSGLPQWEDRLSFLRSAGIEVTPEMYEGFAQVYESEEEA